MSDPHTRPRPGSAAVVLIDVQRDTYADGAPLHVPGTAEAIPAIARLATAFRERGRPIVHAVRWPREHVTYKPRWGVFYPTDLQRHLDESGSDTSVFAGCNFPNCPRTSIYEASERDFRIVLVSDAMSGVYDRGMEECRAIGVDVRNLSSTLAWLEQEGPQRLRA